ncbi:MAG: hypothetical protein Q3998_02320 [Porphyromonas sp.]|nr:hypothetical protein [Porphyromonas sp.]
MKSFFNPQKPKTFRYSYIYTDVKKQKLEKRIRRIQRELDGDEASLSAEDYKDLIEGSISRQSKHLQRSKDKGQTKESRAKSNWWMLLLIVVLAVLFYALYYR